MSAWTNKYSSNVPQTPVNQKQVGSPDWSLDFKTCVDSKSWAFSFDDGPSDPTPKLLDYLKQANLKVTFFVVGSRVSENPQILKRAYDEGHQIGIHTWSHPALTTVSTDVVIAELMYTARIVKETIGVTPRMIRPPYGDIDPRVRAILKNMGFAVIVWVVDSGDSSGNLDAAGTYAAALKTIAGTGVISLEHDLFPAQAEQAPAVVPIITGAGYKIVRMDTCIGQPAYDEGLWSGLASDGVSAPLPGSGGSTPAPPTTGTTTAPAASTATSGSGTVGAGTGRTAGTASTPTNGTNSTATHGNTPSSNTAAYSVSPYFGSIFAILMAVITATFACL
ncbi:hypothetical protein BASA81_015981 [Batrachochytrium salamandrivorans]|nr:hypothetical protein BASA81_015981 [Batrachochytrium salamandrivorans]